MSSGKVIDMPRKTIDIPDPFPVTERDYAHCFVEKYEDRLCYCPNTNTWYEWGEFHWVPTEPQIIRKCIYDMVEELRSVTLRRHDASNARKSIRSMENAKKQSGIFTLIHNALLLDLGGASTSKYELNTRSGLLNLAPNHSLRSPIEPPSPYHRMTRVTAAGLEFDLPGIDQVDPKYPDADLIYSCPQWQEFLSDIMEGNQRLIDYLQRVIGYSLTGDVSENVFFILYGGGSNGKTVFIETIQSVLNDYAQKTNINVFLAKEGTNTANFGLAGLVGARMVTMDEPELGDRFSESALKLTSGDDTISARHPFGRPFSYKPEFKLFITTNHLPEIWGMDHGIWRRVHLIKFPREFSTAEQQVNKKSQLLKERSGIFAWAIEGCKRWQKRGGLEPPVEVMVDGKHYEMDMDMVKMFTKESCCHAENLRVGAQELYDAYRVYCRRNLPGRKVLTLPLFKKEMEKRGYHRQRSATGFSWEGIDLW